MNKYIVAAFFFIGVVGVSLAQKTLADYKYVAVPEQFDFVKGKDKYQVNSLSKFLFKKYGYDAYFIGELPDVTRCEVIWADVEGSSNFIYTKIRVILRDCNGFEIYRSQEGKSKEKEYKKAYHDAIRKAFASFEHINKEDVQIPVVEASTNPVDGPVQTTKPMVEEKDEPIVAEAAKVTVYRYADYKIVPEAGDTKYSVYQGDKKIGRLSPTSGKDTFLVITSEFNGIARRTKRNITIEYQPEGTTEFIEMKFVKNEE